MMNASQNGWKTHSLVADAQPAPHAPALDVANGAAPQPAQDVLADQAHLLHPERLVPRLGDFLLEMGMLQPDDLRAAAAEQQRRHREGRPDLIGRVLLDMNLVDRATLDHAVTLQVMEMHKKLARQNQQLEEKVAQRTAQLQQALERATRLQRHKDEFVNVISHELRTPLTFVLGYLDLIRLGELGPLTSSQSSALANMQAAGDSLYELINNLIFFASFYRQELDASCQPVPVSEIFETALRKKIEPARSRQVRLMVGLKRDRRQVWADVEKIEWVLAELLENALKFTGPGGQVSLYGRLRRRHRFEILVRDNGPGIPPERLEEVFEPFHQLDGSLTRVVGGVGLGLALARGIVQAHGSSLSIASHVGKGTQVSFCLPVYA